MVDLGGGAAAESSALEGVGAVGAATLGPTTVGKGEPHPVTEGEGDMGEAVKYGLYQENGAWSLVTGLG